MYYLKKEIDVSTSKVGSKIHMILNHKRVKQIESAFWNAGKLNTEIKRLIKEVVEGYEICK